MNKIKTELQAAVVEVKYKEVLSTKLLRYPR